MVVFDAIIQIALETSSSQTRLFLTIFSPENANPVIATQYIYNNRYNSISVSYLG